MITVEVWSDVVCPWCYIGKRRLETALRDFEADEVEVVWRSYQLDPSAPAHEARGLVASLVERRLGTPTQVKAMFEHVSAIAAQEGLAYDFDSAQSGNTFDAREDIELAREIGITGVPFFVFDRTFAVSGAQPVEVFTRALQAAHEKDDQIESAENAPGCDDGNCAV